MMDICQITCFRLFAFFVLIFFTTTPTQAALLPYDGGSCEVTMCIRSGMLGENGETWRSSAIYPPPAAVTRPADNWNTISFDDSAWREAGEFGITGDDNSVTPSDSIPDTSASFMWHDPNGTPDGLTGPIEAYFRYVFDFTSTRGVFTAIANIQVDDDYIFYINGAEVFANQDGGNAEIVDTIDFTNWLVSNDTEFVIAIHAVDGGWSNPSDRLFERVLFDATIVDVEEPPLVFLMMFGFTMLLRYKKHSKIS